MLRTHLFRIHSPFPFAVFTFICISGSDIAAFQSNWSQVNCRVTVVHNSVFFFNLWRPFFSLKASSWEKGILWFAAVKNSQLHFFAVNHLRSERRSDCWSPTFAESHDRATTEQRKEDLLLCATEAFKNSNVPRRFVQSCLAGTSICPLLFFSVFFFFHPLIPYMCFSLMQSQCLFLLGLDSCQ